MKLKHGFKQETRLLYLYHYACFICGANGWDRGGLEIHHILGRVSASAFNSSCLCNSCHSKIGHNREEHQKIFEQTYKFLRANKYKPTEEDWQFLEKYAEELIGESLKEIIKS